MQKRRGLIGIIALISILTFGIVPAQAGLSGGIVAGYYNPKIGEINNVYEGTNLKGGLAYGLVLNYDISPNFRIRGEYNTFVSKDSGGYTDSWEGFWGDLWEGVYKYKCKLTTSPIILSGIYRISPDASLCPYIGVGVDFFSTEYTYKEDDKYYLNGSLYDTDVWSFSDTDSPIGFQTLGGVEFRIGNFSLAAEARYIIAKASVGPLLFRTADLGGLFAGLVVSIKF